MIKSIFNIHGGGGNLTPVVEKYWRHISLKFHEEKFQELYHSLIIFHHYLKYAVFLRITQITDDHSGQDLVNRMGGGIWSI